MVEPKKISQSGDDLEKTLRRLTLDLKDADRFLAEANLPHQALEELSETVDHFRATTWAALNAIGEDLADLREAPTLLTAHRIQRARTLLLALNAELDTGHMTAKTPGVEELSSALGATYKKLHYVLYHKAVPPEER